MIRLRLTMPTVMVALAFISHAASGATIESLGTLNFPNSGAPEAQDAFIRGVLLLHSFEYEDAKESFLEAQTIDPDFAMAYWGEAMTYNHPLWRQKDRQAALAALARLAPTTAERCEKAKTKRECGYLKAVETLYAEGNKAALDYAYYDSMRKLSETYPEDLEAKSFYSLSILGTTQAVRDFSAYMRAAAVAEEVFAINPQHPGAAHYLIHSYDDPVHAPLGLRAARVYATIAPAASHAQHMISHIYVAMGQWADSVESNIQSFEVSRERAERKGLSVDALNFHAYHWLQYSYLQLGEWDKARQMLEQMYEYARESGSMRARGYYASMRASWLVETGDTDIPPTLGSENMDATSAAAELFAIGFRALISGDTTGAMAARSAMDSFLAKPADGSIDVVTLEKNRVIQVMADSLQAEILLAEGRDQEAIDLLAQAATIESGMALEYGPPSIVKPSSELYGEVLLKSGQPIEAAVQFENALARAPRRRLSTWGLAQAAAATGNDAVQEAACAELANILANANDEVGSPAVCEPSSKTASQN